VRRSVRGPVSLTFCHGGRPWSTLLPPVAIAGADSVSVIPLLVGEVAPVPLVGAVAVGVVGWKSPSWVCRSWPRLLSLLLSEGPFSFTATLVPVVGVDDGELAEGHRHH
jgi:hypothetical protein